MNKKIDVSVTSLITYGEDLEQAVSDFICAVEKEKSKNNFSPNDREQLEDACIQMKNLIECLWKSVSDYKDLEKSIMDAVMFI